MKASNFGIISNGLTTIAAIPEITYYGKGGERPLFVTWYSLPSASSYSWSVYPPASANQSLAAWDQYLGQGFTPGRVAVGIDQTVQTSDAFKTFLAGALIALAGAAGLAAIVEAVHTRDWEVIRTLRSK